MLGQRKAGSQPDGRDPAWSDGGTGLCYSVGVEVESLLVALGLPLCAHNAFISA